jgi:predicted dehydrogenase
MGNDGVHELDIARWGLGVTTHPSSVSASGGKYFFDDDQQFADTMYVSFEYPGDGKVGHRRQLVFEQRIWTPYVQEGMENGNAFYGTKGMMLLGKKEGYHIFGPRNKPIESMKAGDAEAPSNMRRFVEAIRANKLPNADIEIGHLSASLCHLGNIAMRCGRSLRFDPKTERILDDAEANKLLGRTYRNGHWAAPKGA